MFRPGLVSISFRSLTPEQILSSLQEAGLHLVEWGSDVHAPCHAEERLRQIAALQQEKGIVCCSYGTYFRLGQDALCELPAYMKAARILGTRLLRLWCGNQNSQQYTPGQKEALMKECRAAAAMAEQEGMTLCMECHNGTFTELPEGALELMQTVDSPAFRMYWQPNQNRSEEENMKSARLLAPYVTQIHAFKWVGAQRFSLATAQQEWQRYLTAFSGDHDILLEFMPDDRPESLPGEAEALRRICGQQ